MSGSCSRLPVSSADVCLIFETMNFNLSRDALLIAITASGALLLVTGRYKVVETGVHADGGGVHAEHDRRDDCAAMDAVSRVVGAAARAASRFSCRRRSRWRSRRSALPASAHPS